jgi:heptosyltransferase II
MSNRVADSLQRVLVICLPGIGDTLFFTPALRALRAQVPNLHITALTMIPGARDLLRSNPDVDDVLHFDFPQEGLAKSLRFLRQLRRKRFDAAILSYPSNRLEYNAIALLTGARIRVGHRYNHLDVRCGNWLNTIAVPEDDTLSNVDENLALVEALTRKPSGDTRTWVDPGEDARRRAQEWIRTRGLGTSTLIGFHPGGSTRKNHLNKRWETFKFAELGRKLVEVLDATIVVFGGPEENDVKQRIAYAIGPQCVVESGHQLMDTCAVIERCDYFVSNDSALLHLASALGVPSTGVFGPTSAAWVAAPGFRRRDASLGLDCQPCFHYSPRHLSCRYGDFRCLQQLSAQTVADVVRSAMNNIRRESAAQVAK